MRHSLNWYNTMTEVGMEPVYLSGCSYGGQSPNVSCNNLEGWVGTSNDWREEVELLKTVNQAMMQVSMACFMAST